MHANQAVFKSLTLIVWILFLVLSSVAYGKDNVVVVEIMGFNFSPQKITIAAGTRVRWINKEKRQYHSIWFEKNGETESDYLFPNEQYEKKFMKPGSYPYRCGPHPKMTGIIHVKE